MKQWLSMTLAAAAFSAASIPYSFATNTNQMENQLAKEMAILVLYTELSNVGSRDRECGGVPFITRDTAALVQDELAPVIYSLKIKSEQSDLESREMAIEMLKRTPYQELNGVSVAEHTYQELKQRSVDSFGPISACASLSSMIQTIIHQKRLTIEQLSQQINSD